MRAFLLAVTLAMVGCGDDANPTAPDAALDAPRLPDAPRDARVDAYFCEGDGGLTLSCDNMCVDPQIDHDHCGDCYTTCAAGQVCRQGSCEAD
ncbi:MAG TPA: hypothetical protein VKN99_20955 [Polyangia bacterium]|nr:hypothetical protein [Polyangia bacterium]